MRSSRRLSALFLFVFLFFQFGLPAAALCTQSCHLKEKPQTSSHACCKPKAPSKFEIQSRSACQCSIESHQVAGEETYFALNVSPKETSKLLGVPLNPSTEVVSRPVETTLHGPPESFALTGQDTFLVNSNLRI
jgi:hypothetical protein